MIADDHEPVLSEVAELLQSEFDVVGSATNGVETVQGACQLSPDAIVADFRMPRMNGLEASRIILERIPGTAIVLLTMNNDPELVDSALRAGIKGFVLKDCAGDELVDALKCALKGEVFLSQTLRNS